MVSNPNTVDDRDEDFELWLQQKLDKQKARQMVRRRLRIEEKRKEKMLIQQNNISLIKEVENVQKQNTNLHEGTEKVQTITQNEESEKTETQIFLVSSTPQSKSSSFATNVSSPCAQDIVLGGDFSLSGSKRKRDVLPGSSKKAKGSFSISSGEDISVLPSFNDQSRKVLPQQLDRQQPGNHLSQVLVPNSEVFIGSNSGMKQLSADQSILHKNFAAELNCGTQDPAELAYSTQSKNPWEIYTQIANCLTGAIQATTELHGHVPRLSPSTCETEKLRLSLSKIEKELLHKNTEPEAAFEKTNKQDENTARQVYNSGELMSDQELMLENMGEKNEQCKMVKEHCHEIYWKGRYKGLSTMYHQLQLQKIKERACLNEQYERKLAREKLHAIQTSIRYTLWMLGVSSDKYQSRYKSLVQAMKTQLGLDELPEFAGNGEFASLTPFLHLESEEGDVVHVEEKEVVNAEPASSSKAVNDKAVPTELAIKLRPGESKAAVVNETLATNQIWQLSCEFIPKELGVHGLSSEATDWPPEFNSNGEVTPFIPILDKDSEAGASCLKESEEVARIPNGSSSKGVQNEVAPTELATTCESMQTGHEMNLPSLKPTDSPHEFSSNGEATFIIPFLDMKSEAGSTYIGEKKEEIKAEQGSSNKGVENGAPPAGLAIKLQFKKNEAASVKEIRKTSHIQQLTCDPFQTTPGGGGLIPRPN
ncbi:hypothetical protein FRX31_002573 [Thalictrum thalictroides]|uniref:Uncharacterized protein n=1 Tax=Thalictrum thalictroides TaxID=46969 RepID=A0A7J6XGR9_THATH|nr:hypothetical protein FRX31_002573 [Thalictrum thalictroides]